MPQIPGMFNGQSGPQVQLSRELVLHQAAINVSDRPDLEGAKALRFIQPDGFCILIPLDANGVETLIQALRGTGISIARPGMLPGA